MAIFLDIRTLSFVMGVTVFALTLCMISYSATTKTYPGFGLWTFGTILISLAFILIGFRQFFSSFTTIVTANALIYTALAIFFIGFKSFAKKRQKPYLHTAIVLVLSCFIIPYFTYVVPDVNFRITLISFVAALYFFFSARVLVKEIRPDLVRLNKMLFVTLLLMTCLLTFRGFFFLLPENTIENYMATGGFHGIALLSLMILSIFFVNGLIQLNSQILEKNLYREQRELKESENRFKLAGEVSYDLIYEWEVKSDSLVWFGDIDGILGYTNGEISRDINAWLNLIHPDDVKQLENAVEFHRTSTEPIKYSYRLKDKSGRWRYWSDQALPLINEDNLPYKWIGVCTDITERKQAEDQIAKSLKEKEILLRETHHRIKNNLNIITSLLDLQRNQCRDSRINREIDDAKSRVMAMALVHNLLYSTKNLAEIDFEKYVKQLGSNLINIMEMDNYQAHLIVEIENIYLKLDQAIPCGLLLNELLTNALKYAFNDDSGQILISARYITSDEIELAVHDNGIGLSNDIIPSETSTMGLKIVYLLVTEQLEGTIEMKKDKGTCFLIRFPVS